MNSLKQISLLVFICSLQGVAFGQPLDFRSIRHQSLNQRKALLAGKASGSVVLTSYLADGKVISETKSLEANFNSTAYTAVIKTTSTSGFQFKRTDPNGQVTFDHPTNEDEVYFRQKPFSTTTTSYILERTNEKITSINFLGNSPRMFTFVYDFLAAGVLLPREPINYDFDAIKIDSIDGNDILGKTQTKEGEVRVKANKSMDYLLSDCELKNQDYVEHVAILSSEEKNGVSIPSHVIFEFFAGGKLESKAELVLSNIILGDTTKPLFIKLPGNFSVNGFYDNSMYLTDGSGDPHFVSTKGYRAPSQSKFGWLFVGSLALLIFATVSLIWQVLRRRSKLGTG
ncbi:MAG: hypothetical protein WCI55_11595 [Armatimonadota bacterium]